MGIGLYIFLVKKLYGIVNAIPSRYEHPVLIVEDCDIDADTITEACKLCSVKTERVKTVAEAQAKLLSQKFRLVFVDENLGPRGGRRESGLELVEWMSIRFHKVPVTIITANQDISAKLWAGMEWSFILKASHGGAMMNGIHRAILKSNGVNGHGAPLQIVFVMYAVSMTWFFTGLFCLKVYTWVHELIAWLKTLAT